MDKLTNYRNLIKRILTEYVELSNQQPQPGIEAVTTPSRFAEAVVALYN